jgi:hypothetical protein
LHNFEHGHVPIDDLHDDNNHTTNPGSSAPFVVPQAATCPNTDAQENFDENGAQIIT